MSSHTSTQLITRDEIRELVDAGTLKSVETLGIHLVSLVLAATTFVLIALGGEHIASTVDPIVGRYALMGVSAFIMATGFAAAWYFVRDAFYVLASVAATPHA